MRTASLIMLSGLFVQVAHAADDISLSTFPNVLQPDAISLSRARRARSVSFLSPLAQCSFKICHKIKSALDLSASSLAASLFSLSKDQAIVAAS